MRKMFVGAVLACLCALVTVDTASACGRGWYGYGWRCCDWDGYYGGYYGRGYYGRGYYGGWYYGSVPYYYGGGYVVTTPASAPATLIVSLPADAVLTIDGEPTTSTSAQRVFSTPALEPNRNFEYTLEAKVVRDGQPKVISQRVIVRAGTETRVRMEMPTAAAE
jgi:uncharacterized protein (TIGR03000 family)